MARGGDDAVERRLMTRAGPRGAMRAAALLAVLLAPPAWAGHGPPPALPEPLDPGGLAPWPAAPPPRQGG